MRTKKGISPILAKLLLIVIAVTAVVVTYAWIMTFTGVQTQPDETSLIQENVSWPTASTIEVVIRNIGTSDVTITAVYMGTFSTNLNLNVTMYPPAGSSSAIVEAGLTNRFIINYQWIADTRYYFKFATDKTKSLDFSEQSP